MCIQITLVDVQPEIAIWDPDEVTIFLHRGTRLRDAERELRAILSDLGAPESAGLYCFCGDVLAMPHGLAPRKEQPRRVIPLTRRQVLRGA